jgi:DNA invertase Pin-like site-specific DNA recombinase
VSYLKNQGGNLEGIDQNIHTSNPEGKLFFTFLASFAEFERKIMRSRTIDGLASARARGRVGGLKPAMSPAKIATAKQIHREGKYVKDIAEVLGVSRPTIYRSLE